MKTIFDYLYYKISNFYKNFGEKDFCMFGSLVLFSTFSLIFMSVLSFVLKMFSLKINIYIFGTMVVLIAAISYFFIDRNKYDTLHERWKNERNSKFKGLLVLLYIIFSIIFFIISMYYSSFN